MPASSHILLHLLGFAHFYLSVKNHCFYLFQLLEADDNPAHGVQRPVDHLLVDAPRLPLLLATLELLLPLLLGEHPGGFHPSSLTQPGMCRLFSKQSETTRCSPKWYVLIVLQARSTCVHIFYMFNNTYNIFHNSFVCFQFNEKMDIVNL